MVMYACNPRTGEAKTRETGQPSLLSEFQASATLHQKVRWTALEK